MLPLQLKPPRTVRLPVIYVFAKQAIDAAHAAIEIAQAAVDDLQKAKAAVLMYDVAFEWRSAEVKSELAKMIGVPVILSTIDRSAALDKGKSSEKLEATDSCGSCSTCAGGSARTTSALASATNGHTDSNTASRSRRHIDLPDGVDMRDALILYLGEESLGLTNLLMTHPSTPVRCRPAHL